MRVTEFCPRLRRHVTWAAVAPPAMLRLACLGLLFVFPLESQAQPPLPDRPKLINDRISERIAAIARQRTELLASPAFVMVPWSEVADDAAPEKLEGGDGRRVADGDSPATHVITGDLGTCTATAVGPGVVLTAAHCVEDEALGVVQLPGCTASMRCNRYPAYEGSPEYGPPDHTADFALCHPIPDLDVDWYENVDDGLRPLLTTGATVHLQGFGCIDNNSLAVALYEGTAEIEDLPPVPPPPHYTRMRSGFLCHGDSGGGAYVADGASFVLIGVNSQVLPLEEKSDLATIRAGGFIEWARDVWAPGQGAKICGLHADATGCRP